MWVRICGAIIIVSFIIENNTEEAADNIHLTRIQDCWYHQEIVPVHNFRAVGEN